MRGKRDLGMAPEWTVLRQGFGLEDIERRGIKSARIEGGEDIAFDLLLAAPGIDEDGCAERALAGKLRDHLAIDEAGGFRRMRQEADENIRSFQERIEFIGSRKTFYARNGFA